MEIWFNRYSKIASVFTLIAKIDAVDSNCSYIIHEDKMIKSAQMLHNLYKYFRENHKTTKRK